MSTKKTPVEAPEQIAPASDPAAEEGLTEQLPPTLEEIAMATFNLHQGHEEMRSALFQKTMTLVHGAAMMFGQSQTPFYRMGPVMKKTIVKGVQRWVAIYGDLKAYGDSPAQCAQAFDQAFQTVLEGTETATKIHEREVAEQRRKDDAAVEEAEAAVGEIQAAESAKVVKDAVAALTGEAPAPTKDKPRISLV